MHNLRIGEQLKIFIQLKKNSLGLVKNVNLDSNLRVFQWYKCQNT